MTANSKLKTLIRFTTLFWLLCSRPCVATEEPEAPPLRERKAAAEVLFEQGKELVRQGDIPAGCIKFEESQNLDAGVGTQFNLADCYEQLGRLASAYAIFMEVAATTRQRGQSEREALARERADALKPRLSRLVIAVDPSKTPPGISVVRNGTPVGQAQWGVAIPVDPGQVRVTVRAPDRQDWEVVVDIRSEGQSEQVVVPNLEPITRTPPVTVSVIQKDSPRFLDQTKNRVALGLTGAGLVGVGLFTYFGLKSEAKYRSTDAHCDAQDKCAPEALAARKRAYADGTNANISLIAGAACLVAGGVLMLLDETPSTERNATALHAFPILSTHAYGAGVGGAF